ncbi:ExbD/TolR family protein [Spongiivirga citrea]|uniref:Biopolymer transporter ExbD n=1 Tax=Spongiivirga citrea TaxID=1481457 RepID=A0A6M0CI71_9FLAO|nr:biopolymer transporter ExbD [Spongiivirga citrea]NER15629.1 biopolymer transporter ExbD [Spongiivirga citrea]
MRFKKEPGLNAGSMADIAFLMLIFFLVVTKIEADEGINTRLASNQETPIIDINKRNILQVSLNDKNEVFVEDGVAEVEELTELAKAFIDNNGDGSCDYCDGKQLATSSDNPDQAIVSLQHMRTTDYKFYVTVQNELIKAYNELRNEEAIQSLGRSFNELSSTEQKEIKKKYPRKLSEIPLASN